MPAFAEGGHAVSEVDVVIEEKKPEPAAASAAPRRTRASRAAAAAATNGEAAESAAREEPVAHDDETPVSATASETEPTPEAPAPAAPRRTTASSEPRLERIVIGQQNEAEVVAEDASASAAPARKGWWQRKLGGE